MREGPRPRGRPLPSSLVKFRQASCRHLLHTDARDRVASAAANSAHTAAKAAQTFRAQRERPGCPSERSNAGNAEDTLHKATRVPFTGCHGCHAGAAARRGEAECRFQKRRLHIFDQSCAKGVWPLTGCKSSSPCCCLLYRMRGMLLTRPQWVSTVRFFSGAGPPSLPRLPVPVGLRLARGRQACTPLPVARPWVRGLPVASYPWLV